MKDKPRILALKPGYNPNSSSIGFTLWVFLWSTLPLSILFSMLGLFLRLKGVGRRNQGKV